MCKFFSKTAAMSGSEKALWIRIGNQLSRNGIKIMEQLCDMPPERLRGLHNIGEKGFAVALAGREKY